LENLWDKSVEERFFREKLRDVEPSHLFYMTDGGEYLAYWPRSYQGSRTTLQSRNSLIGDYTEKWSRDLIKEIVRQDNLYAVQKAICDELTLTRQSSGDVVISRKNSIVLEPEDIVAIFEVKMSIVWNWKYTPPDQLLCVGDYRTHSGNPGLLRSDSMLKAIGKGINIRISSSKAARIPIIVLGNTPITRSYYDKVDQLYQSGIIQGFWSLNPAPLDRDHDSEENIKQTPKGGFYRFDNLDELVERINSLYTQETIFFSGMKSKSEIGEIIEQANRGGRTYEEKGELFLKLLGG